MLAFSQAQLILKCKHGLYKLWYDIYNLLTYSYSTIVMLTSVSGVVFVYNEYVLRKDNFVIQYRKLQGCGSHVLYVLLSKISLLKTCFPSMIILYNLGFNLWWSYISVFQQHSVWRFIDDCLLLCKPYLIFVLFVKNSCFSKYCLMISRAKGVGVGKDCFKTKWKNNVYFTTSLFLKVSKTSCDLLSFILSLFVSP